MKVSIIRWAFLSCSLMSCALDNEESDTGGAGEVAEQSQALAAGTVVTFKNFKSGLCMGVDHASTANGALVKQFGCDNTSNQRWSVQSSSNLNVFTNGKSGLCMGVDGASVSAGANIGQFNCGNFAPNQSWVVFQGSSSIQFNLINNKSGLCIGVDGGSTASGAQLKQFSCNFAAPNQNWGIIFH